MAFMSLQLRALTNEAFVTAAVYLPMSSSEIGHPNSSKQVLGFQDLQLENLAYCTYQHYYGHFQSHSLYSTDLPSLTLYFQCR